jgi:PAS domain S-box-containing protein
MSDMSDRSSQRQGNLPASSLGGQPAEGQSLEGNWLGRRVPLLRHLDRPDLQGPRARGRVVAIILGVALVYCGTGWAGLQIPFPATFATLIWAPSGIALYAVLRWGWAGAVGVIIGAACLAALVGPTVAYGVLTAIGSALPAIIATRFLPKMHFVRLFGDTTRVTRYIALAVILSTIASAAVGATAIKTVGWPVPADWLHVFVTWWAGDAMGVLAIAPALLAVGQLRRMRQPRQLMEFVAIIGSFAVIWYLLFAEILNRSTALPLSYVAIPLVIWVALRFEQAVALLVSLVVILVAVLATARGFGPFVLAAGIEPSYILLHCYLAVIAVTTLYLSASAASGRRAVADLKQEIIEQRRIRARLTATNELSGDAIITVSEAGLITSFNPAATALFGYTLPEVIGQPFARLMPLPELSTRKAQLEEFMRTGEHPLQAVRFQETRYRRKDGSEVTTLAAIARVSIDQAISGIVAIRDMTETRGRESALRDALREAQLAIRARNVFLANMSHELRTPLNAIIGFAETLRLRLFGTLNDRQADYIADIETSGRHLLTLINGILNYARLEKGDWQPAAESVDVSLAVAASCRMLVDKAGRRQIALRQTCAERLPQLYCDPVALRQIVINLVDNAIKFSPVESVIEVAASLMPSGDRLLLAVTDQGIGIHQADQRRILEPFIQAAQASTRDHEGLGLGLSIVKHLVDAHQAELQLESVPGHGTTISVIWPAERLLATSD